MIVLLDVLVTYVFRSDMCEVIVSVSLQGTASEATFVALLAARSRTVATAKKDVDKATDGRVLSKLVAYCSDQVTE